MLQIIAGPKSNKSPLRNNRFAAPTPGVKIGAEKIQTKKYH